jgi:hypothetical protein
MAMFQKYWRTETGFFLAIWSVLMVGGRSRFFQDPGTFWHTVVGGQMLDTKQLIYRDTFSFTFAGQPWSPHQWLGECLMALLHRVDGLDTLLLATVTILAGLYTWLAGRLLRSGLHWSLAAVVVGLTVAASSSHFHIRPHLATIVFMGCTFGYLCDFEAGRKNIRHLLWLVPIYWFWTNVHGGILGGLATMGFALGGWCGTRFIGKTSPIGGVRQAGAFGLLILACAATAFINPYGLRLPQIWLDIMRADLPGIIQEHAPLDPSRPDGWIVLVFGLVYLLALVSVWPNWPRITWLLPCLWFYLACSRIRHAPLFAITAALAIADILPCTAWARRVARSGSDLFRFPDAVRPMLEARGVEHVACPSSSLSPHPSSLLWRPALLPIGVILLSLVLQVGQVPVPVFGHRWARLDADYWPTDILPNLQPFQYTRAKGTPIFNEYLFGGFLIYNMPGLRVFVDDRCELYGDRWLENYVRAEWQETARYFIECEKTYQPFDLALTRTGSGFDRFFDTSAGWHALRRTEAATLYERRVASGRVASGDW